MLSEAEVQRAVDEAIAGIDEEYQDLTKPEQERIGNMPVAKRKGNGDAGWGKEHSM